MNDVVLNLLEMTRLSLSEACLPERSQGSPCELGIDCGDQDQEKVRVAV